MTEKLSLPDTITAEELEKIMLPFLQMALLAQTLDVRWELGRDVGRIVSGKHLDKILQNEDVSQHVEQGPQGYRMSVDEQSYIDELENEILFPDLGETLEAMLVMLGEIKESKNKA